MSPRLVRNREARMLNVTYCAVLFALIDIILDISRDHVHRFLPCLRKCTDFEHLHDCGDKWKYHWNNTKEVSVVLHDWLKATTDWLADWPIGRWTNYRPNQQCSTLCSRIFSFNCDKVYGEGQQSAISSRARLAKAPHIGQGSSYPISRIRAPLTQ